MRIAFVVLALLLAGCAGAPTTPQAPRNTTTPSSTSDAPQLPKVVDMRLSEAKELLAGQGYPVTEEDATGKGRPILEPFNWVVDAQLPEAGASAPRGTKVVLKVRKPSDAAGDPTAAKGTVPNVVCKDLQSAQDTLQAAGFYLLGSEDATGQGRQQVVDRNWVVVSQSAVPGSTPDTATKIVLGAVKFGEPTGGSGCAS
jgi:beta-lactam-binding protein with PASTA domain